MTVQLLNLIYVAGSCTATMLDWMGHRPLGHARSIRAITHYHQLLLGRPEHTFEYNYSKMFYSKLHLLQIPKKLILGLQI